MKRILRLLSEPRRKRLASAAVGNKAEFLNALGGNAQLHRWLREQHAFPYFQSRYDLYADIQSKILGKESIDYLEFGVRYGDSLFKWSTINAHPDSRFFGFDSFEGIPEAWASVTGEAPKGAFSVGGAVPQTNDSRTKNSVVVSSTNAVSCMKKYPHPWQSLVRFGKIRNLFIFKLTRNACQTIAPIVVFCLISPVSLLPVPATVMNA